MGTTYKSIFSIVFALILNLVSFNAFAGDPPKSIHASQQLKGSQLSAMQDVKLSGIKLENNNRTAVVTDSSQQGCDVNSSKVPISEITYVGFKYSGNAFCVNATNDSDAREKCTEKSSGWRAVNPANPQYGTEISESRTTNSAGFYWCVETNPSLEEFAQSNQISMDKLQNLTSAMLNDKESLCEIVAKQLSPWRTVDGETLNFQFQKGGRTDGDCQCQLPDGPWQNCDQYPPAEALASPAAVPANPVAPSAPLAVAANGVTVQLERCINRFVQAANSCKEEAQKAVDSCDERNPNNVGNRNSGVNMAAGATEIMGQIYNMKNQAAGMQAECFRAGAAANTASTAIRGMKEECSRDSGRCQSLCRGADGKTKEEEFKDVCARTIGKTKEQLESEGSPDSAAFASAAQSIRETSTEGLNLCTGEVKKKSNVLDNLLSGIGRALQSSVQCACQTSSTATNCENIPPVQDCTAIPQPPGCGAYEAMATCTPGSAGYSAKMCACVQNPAGPGCAGGSNAVSSFSGPPIAGNLAQGTPGGVNFGGGAGGGRASNLDLRGANNDVDSDLSFLGSKSNGAAAANSVGGGAPSSAGGASNGDIRGEKGSMPLSEEEKGIGGIFSAARNFMSNALGLGKKPVAKDTKNGPLGKPDMGKFKPLRGLAGRSSSFGSKNMDIWKMMNACSSGDTCKSNEGNYLVAP